MANLKQKNQTFKTPFRPGSFATILTPVKGFFASGEDKI